MSQSELTNPNKTVIADNKHHVSALSEFGKNIKVTIKGRANDDFISGTVKGIPEGLAVDLKGLSEFIARRKAADGVSVSTDENNVPYFVSGLKNGVTDGKPITVLFKNSKVRGADYLNLKNIPRPSHSDYTRIMKYGFSEAETGGGHSSGRVTLPLTAIGYVCKKALETKGIYIGSHILSIGKARDEQFNPVAVCRDSFPADNAFPTLLVKSGDKMKSVISKAAKKKNSVGGIVECAVVGLPVGIGEPNFRGLENVISEYAFGIPAVKAIEFGNGYKCTTLTGKKNNDEFYFDENKVIKTYTNNSGGINGGISNGMPLIFNVAIKPVPSISIKQRSVNFETNENCIITIKGRHNPCIVPRIPPILEAVTAIAVYDLFIDYVGATNDLSGLRSKIDRLDLEIASLFEKRLEIVKEIKQKKTDVGVPLFDTQREAAVIKHVADNVSEEYRDYTADLYKNIVKYSRDLQRK